MVKAATQLYALAETDEDAKQLVLGYQWGKFEITLASEQGWALHSSGQIALGMVNFRFQNREEAAEYVKQLAQNGDILAQKALVESARRQLNGNSKNDGSTTSGYPQ